MNIFKEESNLMEGGRGAGTSTKKNSKMVAVSIVFEQGQQSWSDHCDLDQRSFITYGQSIVF